MKWENFTYQGTTYDLTHLHPIEWTCVQEADLKKKKPERQYRFKVVFSLHCFTDHIDPAVTDRALHYSDQRETRAFCFTRYALSKRLPEIVQDLHNRKVCHTTKGNYITVDITDEEGQPQHYEVYFQVSKSSQRGFLNLFVESGYVRDEEHDNVTKSKPISFHVIAYNTQHKKPIKVPTF